jgi:hypothetical protein
VTKAGGKRVRRHQLSRCVVIDSLDDEVDEAKRGAARGSRRIRWSKRDDREEWRARKLGGERGGLPGVFTG